MSIPQNPPRRNAKRGFATQRCNLYFLGLDNPGNSQVAIPVSQGRWFTWLAALDRSNEWTTTALSVPHDTTSCEARLAKTIFNHTHRIMPSNMQTPEPPLKLVPVPRPYQEVNVAIASNNWISSTHFLPHAISYRILKQGAHGLPPSARTPSPITFQGQGSYSVDSNPWMRLSLPARSPYAPQICLLPPPGAQTLQTLPNSNIKLAFPLESPRQTPFVFADLGGVFSIPITRPVDHFCASCSQSETVPTTLRGYWSGSCTLTTSYVVHSSLNNKQDRSSGQILPGRRLPTGLREHSIRSLMVKLHFRCVVLIIIPEDGPGSLFLLLILFSKGQ